MADPTTVANGTSASKVAIYARPVTPVRRDVTASATAVTLFPAATDYQPGTHSYNATPEAMYINEDGSNPTISSYGDVVYPGETYVMDPPISGVAVKAIWPSANGGTARCTDYKAP